MQRNAQLPGEANLPARDRQFSIMGVRCHALSLSELTRTVEEAVALKKQQCIVAHHNLHSLYLYYSDSRMREFYDRAAYVHVDGMSIILLSRLLGLSVDRSHRVTYVDWMGPLMKTAAEQGWRIFYLGSKPGVAEKGRSILRSRFPSLCLDTAHGYFNATRGSADNRSILNKIGAYKPDVLMVGMGMPRQEHWVLDNLEDLAANAILLSGAAMDYVAGDIPTPPRWSGQIGLEWLFRLAGEPRRLWNRYLLEPWFLLRMLMGARARGQSLQTRNSRRTHLSSRSALRVPAKPDIPSAAGAQENAYKPQL
jgi:N-acetylglucosaminyldiphosphoundecaprenol N-acetyl-beta-D-mannosaminyltransferase